MVEPAQLRRGKLFQRKVRVAFSGFESRQYQTLFEHSVAHKNRKGRADIVLTDDGDFLAVLEIKATKWNRIRTDNINRNLWRHQHQLLRYIDKFLEVDQLSVSPGIIYPQPPRDEALRKHIEAYLEDRGIPVYWFSELNLG